MSRRPRWGILGRLGAIAGVLLSSCATGRMRDLTPGPAAGSYEPGELLVEFKAGTREARIKEVHRLLGSTPLEEIVPRVWRSGVPRGREAAWISRFKVFAEVRYAEVNGRIRPQMVGRFRPWQPAGQVRSIKAKVNDRRFVPDPLGLPAQWGLHRVGLCAPDLQCAPLDRATGEGIKVAVIDTGVDANHPDLRENLLLGKNFLEGVNASTNDDFGHGTHVAGIIAAGLNGIGIVGMAPRAKIIPIRVLGLDGGNTGGLIKGLRFAVDQGAQVVNLSLGSSQTSQIESEQMARAIAENIVVVAAAGNEALSGNPLEYPAALPGVIGVAATKRPEEPAAQFREHAEFSNFNPFVSVAAPGVDILSTVPRGFFAPTVDPNDDANAYAYASGTSMAAPMVSGLVSLILSTNRGLSPAGVRQLLQNTAIDLGDKGFDDFYGWGLISVPGAIP